MTGCSAKSCRNSTVKGYVMKRFPRDPARRTAWALNVNRDGWTPTNASCLCEVHFDDSMWEELEWDGTPKLKRTAVPTLFCNCTYGRKRGKGIELSQNANARVMTEHSYGSVQGIDSLQTIGTQTHISKGRTVRRGDHQYAISAEEEDKKKSSPSDESKKENLSHDLSCPLYGKPMRRHSLAMDKNNNGEKKKVDASVSEGFQNVTVHSTGNLDKWEGTALLQDDSGVEASLVQGINDTSVDGSPLENTSVNYSPHTEVLTALQPQILLLIPDNTSVRPETALSNITINTSTKNKVSSYFGTKDNCANIEGTTSAPGCSSQIQLLSDNSNRCSCQKETINATKVKAAERVLARQARLAKQVAALQKKLLQQTRTHQLEVDELLKKFHQLEEKFDLTKNILRSCVGDDQLTVRLTDNSRGVVWSKKTIQKALQLRSSCGLVGYNTISKLLIPLPSDRTLQRWNQRSKSHEGIFVEIPKEGLDK